MYAHALNVMNNERNEFEGIPHILEISNLFYIQCNNDTIHIEIIRYLPRGRM